jgi:hypothetical protein
MRWILVAVLVGSLCFPGVLFAQGLFTNLLPTGATRQETLDAVGPETGGMIANLPQVQSLNLGPFFINPTAQVGYTRVGANFTLPIEGEQAVGPLGLQSLQIGSLDLKVEDAEFWLGALGLNVILPPKLSFFGLAGGVAPRLIVAPGSVPISLGPASVESTIIFTGANVESWFVQFGMGYSFTQGASIIGGFYWDHFSLELQDPREPGGIPLSNQTLRGDLVAKMWFPFIGIQVIQPNYMGMLMYGFSAVADVNLALRNSQNLLQDLRYSWNQPGQYLSGLFQYNVTPPPVVLSFWVNGSWRHVDGGGDLELDIVNLNPPPTSGLRAKQTNASMGMYTVGVGVTLGVMF